MAVTRRPLLSAAYPTKHVPRPHPYWVEKGLVLSFLGNRLIYCRDTPVIPTLTQTGTPKPRSGPHSDAVGFGTTYGTGTTDMLTGGVLPVSATRARSVFTSVYYNTTGGGGLGRIFQDVTGTGVNGGESFYANGTTQILYNNFIVASATICTWTFATTLPSARWATIGISIPDITGVAVVGSCYIDGKLATTATNGAVTGGVGSNVATNLTWGNRASDGARGFDGMIGVTHFFEEGLSAEDAADLDANANCVWYAPRIRRTVSTGTYTASITEALSFADIASNIAALTAALAEAATADATQDAVVGRFSTISEANAFADAANGILGRFSTATATLTLADVPDRAFGATLTITEAATLAATHSAVYAASATAVEAMSLADAASGALAGGSFSATVTEAAVLADAQTQAYGASGATVEALTLADTVGNVAALGATATDALVLDSTQSTGTALAATATEAVTLADTRSATAQYLPTISEPMVLASAQAQQAALSAALVEALSLDTSATAAWGRYVSLVASLTLATTVSQALNAAFTESAFWAYQITPQSLRYSVVPQNLHYSVTPQNLHYTVEAQNLAYDVTTSLTGNLP